MVKLVDLLLDAFLNDASSAIDDYINRTNYYEKMVPSDVETRLRKIQDRLDELFTDRSWVKDNEYACDVHDTIDYLMRKLNGDDITPSVLSDVEETLFKRKPKK